MTTRTSPPSGKPTQASGFLHATKDARKDDPLCRRVAACGAGPRTGAEATDGLDEYAGDFRSFAKPDGRMLAGILKRRRRQRPLEDPHAEEALSPGEPRGLRPQQPAFEPAENGAGFPVRLVSAGRTLIVGRCAEQVRALGRRLGATQSCLMLVEDPEGGPASEEGPEAGVLRVSSVRVRGCLGRFLATAEPGRAADRLNREAGGLEASADLVLDLRPTAEAGRALRPLGYYTVAEGDDAELERVMAELPQMIGVFEKPRFVGHAAESCARVRSGALACGRCIAACPVAAIAGADEGIRVDHAACVGCGLCSVACPTGAMRCLHPAPGDVLADVRRRLAETAAEAAAPAVVFFTPQPGAGAVDEIRQAFGDSAIAFPVAAVGGLGPEVWLGALAYGARRVDVLLPGGCPEIIESTLASELGWVQAVLAGVGLSGEKVRLLPPHSWLPRASEPGGSRGPQAGLPPFLAKRALIRRSLEHLAAACGNPRAAALLPAGAPFGGVILDVSACTLCMACAGACPTGALSAAGGAPSLRLTESDCIQCGRCRTICPERALELVPRMTVESARSEKPQVLHSEEALCCIRCGKPFAAPGLVAKVAASLEGHWMYGREEERRRLRMCRDCRVRDLFARGAEDAS